MRRGRFLRLVERALASVPEPFSRMLENVDLVVEARPSRRVLRENGMEPGETLVGGYEAIPLSGRGSG